MGILAVLLSIWRRFAQKNEKCCTIFMLIAVQSPSLHGNLYIVTMIIVKMPTIYPVTTKRYRHTDTARIITICVDGKIR